MRADEFDLNRSVGNPYGIRRGIWLKNLARNGQFSYLFFLSEPSGFTHMSSYSDQSQFRKAVSADPCIFHELDLEWWSLQYLLAPNASSCSPPTPSFWVVRKLLEKNKSHCKLFMSEWRKSAKAHIPEITNKQLDGIQMNRVLDRVPASQEAAPLRFNISLVSSTIPCSAVQTLFEWLLSFSDK